MTDDRAPLTRLAQGMRAAAAARRTRFAVDGLTLYLDLENPNPHLSVAVPDDDPPADWGPGLADLRRLCARHGRAARIEAFAELHPRLLEAADAAGWRRAMTAPVLTLAPADLAPPHPPVGDYRPLDPDDRARLEAALRGSHEAYGGDPHEPAALDWLPGLSQGLREGRMHAGAVDLAGRPVAGAVVMLGGDVGELAGVWTRPELRRRGLARQACRALLAEAFDAGLPLAWLSAAEGALRLYEGLGFVRVGTQVNLEGP